MVNHPAPWRNVRAILPYNTATAPVFPLNPWARYNLEQYVPYHKHTHFRCTLHASTVRNFFTNIPTSGVPYTPVQYIPCSQTYSLPVHPTVRTLFTNTLASRVPYTPVQCVPCSQTYSLPVYPTRQYSTYLVHKHTHFRCTLHASTVHTLFTNILASRVPYTPVQCVPCSQTHSLPVYPTRQYRAYLVHKHTHFWCSLHASTVRTLFTNILTSGVPYTPVQYIPCSQTYSLPVYPTRQYSAYLVHKHTRFPCTLHASTVRTLFTNILTSGVPYTPVQYVPCSQTYSLPVYPTRQYSTYLVHKHTRFPCTLHASTVRTLFTNILTSGVPYTPVQYIPCSQTYLFPVYHTRQYSTYLVHKHTRFPCTLHASTVHTLFTNILTSGVPYTPVQYVPCSQTYSLPVYPTRQYSTYLVHKHTRFPCTLHASTVRTLFTNTLASRVPYTPVQCVPCSQTYSLLVFPTRQYSTYLVHKHTHFRCTLHASTVHTLFTNILAFRVPYTPVQRVPCSQIYPLLVFPTRQYSTYLVHKHTCFPCTTHASTVRTLFTNILASRVPYTPVQYIPCSQTYSLLVYFTRQYSTYLVRKHIHFSCTLHASNNTYLLHKHTHFRCILHASTVRTLFTNILTCVVPTTPVQYVPCSQTYSLPVYPTRQYSRYLVHKHTHFRCILHASTIRTLGTNITTSGVPFTAFAASPEHSLHLHRSLYTYQL